jgi:proteasome lid subunit RPN8/RPN11
LEDSLERKNSQLNNIPKEVLLQCKNYALKFEEEESCGIIVKHNNSFLFKSCENIHPDKKYFFAINPMNLVDNVVEYIFHSHWNGGSRPSSCDIKSSDELCIPFLIYSLTDDDFYLYRSISV